MNLHTHYELLTHWLHANPQWGWGVAFLISFAESVAIIGSIVPGSVTMTAIGILAGSGVIPIWTVVIYAILGAIFGDGISYFAGYYLNDRLNSIWPFSRYPNTLEKGRLFFSKYGRMSVFIGRFVGPVRAMVPIIAGMLNMKPKRYFPISILSATLWAPAYMLPGILLGAISLEMPKHVAAELIIFILLLLVMIWLIAVGIRYVYTKTHTYFSTLLDEKWQLWRTQPSKKWFCTLLYHAERPNHRGQLLLAINILLAGILFLSLLAFTFFGASFQINGIVYHLFRGIRTETLNEIMVFLSAFGDEKVLLPLLPILFLWFAFRKRWLLAWHWLSAGIVCGGSIFVLKHLFFAARPPGILHLPTDSSFPSGHTTLAVVFYGLLAFFSTKTVPKLYRKYLYGATSIACVLIGISRIYLGLHWFTDVIAGALLGLSILGLTTFSYHRLKPIRFSIKGMLIVAALTLSTSAAFYLHTHYKTELKNYAPFWKTTLISEQTWWTEQSNQIPQYRNNRFGYPTEIFNIQWAGTLKEIKATLYLHGWKNLHPKKEKTDYLSTLQKVAKQHPVAQRSLLPELFNDQSPILECIHYRDKFPPVILHLWNANTLLVPSKTPLWVGTIEYDIEKKYLLFFKKRSTQINTSEIRKTLLPLSTVHHWKTKTITPTHIPEFLKKKHAFEKTILLKDTSRN